MIGPLALASMAAGGALGYIMMRRYFMLRVWVALILALISLTLLVLTNRLPNILPEALATQESELAVALLTVLVPPPLAAGLLVGGIMALMMRRHAKPS